MELITLSWLDYILFCLIFGGSCVLGIYFGCYGNRLKTKGEYLLGGRKMAITPVAVSLMASTLSPSSLLGIPTEMYLYGTEYWMMCLSVLLAGLCTIYIFVPVFYRLGITTLYEYLELRFNIHVRRMVSLIYVLDCLTIMPCVVYAPALAFNQMSGFDVHYTAICLSIICIFYTALGGLRGVVWSSTLQFSITLCTLCFVIVMGTISAGGWSDIWEKSQMGNRLEFFNTNPDPTLRGTFWSVVIGNMFVWINYMATNPAPIQRLLALPQLSDCTKTLFIYIAGTIVAKSLCCFGGLIMFAKYFTCDPLSAGYVNRPDQIFPYFVLDVASSSPGVSGLFVAAMFSTTLSALSSIINALSGSIYVDFVERHMPVSTSERAASTAMKGISVLLGIITIGLVFVVERLGTILQLIVSFSGIVAGPTVGVCTLGLLFPMANSKGAISGATTSIVLMWILAVGRYITNVDNAIEYLPKPLQTYGCNATTILDTLTETDGHSIEPPWVFKLSFYYYGFLGTVITVVVGLLVSWATNKHGKRADLSMITPLVHCFAHKTSKISTSKEKVIEMQKDLTEPFLT